MDDGGRLCYNTDYVRKGLVLNTQGVAADQVKVLSENLNNAYNLKSSVKTKQEKSNYCFFWQRICTNKKSHFTASIG